MRAHIQIEAQERLEPGDAGDVRCFAGLYLRRKLFVHDLVGNRVDDDLDVRVFRLKAIQKVPKNSTLVAVIVPSDMYFNRILRCDAHDHRREQKCNHNDLTHSPSKKRIRWR